jgi:CheY-like chemotaxis protein
LVVDDDPDARQILCELLTNAGYKVTLARDGRDAMNRLERARSAADKPTAIVLDLMMPNLDGEGFLKARQRKASLAEIPVVAVSAFGDRLRDVRQYADAVLPKPLDLGRLTALVARLSTR